MRRLVSIAALLAVFAVVPLAAQDDGPHVYAVTYVKAKPGMAGDYSTYLRQTLAPLYEEFVKHEDMASYHMFGQWSGSGEYSHVFMIEWVSWDAMNNGLTAVGSESWEAACEAAHGRTWAEVMEGVDLNDMRVLLRREFSGSFKP